jgi:hypothetical protein
MTRSLNVDDRHVAALSYEAVRAVSAGRVARIGSIVAALDVMSAGADSARVASADVDSTDADGTDAENSDVASADVASADLMIRQASYRSAAAALANPVAPSLLAFLS